MSILALSSYISARVSAIGGNRVKLVEGFIELSGKGGARCLVVGVLAAPVIAAAASNREFMAVMPLLAALMFWMASLTESFLLFKSEIRLRWDWAVKKFVGLSRALITFFRQGRRGKRHKRLASLNPEIG